MAEACAARASQQACDFIEEHRGHARRIELLHALASGGSQFGAQNDIVPQQLASGDHQHFPDDIIERAF